MGVHFPLHFEFWGLSLSGHAAFEIFAHLAGLFCFRQLRRHYSDTFSKLQRIRLMFYTILGALLGSKIIGAVELLITAPNWTDLTFTEIFHSKTIVGGLLGGLVFVELYKKAAQIKSSTGDLYVFPLIISIIIGRMGCFSAGIYDGTHGIASSLPWAMDMGDGVLRHPTQLYEIIFLSVLGLVLYKSKFQVHDGASFKIFLSSYLIFRLFVEFIKPVTLVALHLSAIQWACIFGLVYYLKIFIFSGYLQKVKHARKGLFLFRNN